MKYKCKYYNGGGVECDGGIWEKKETPKQIIFTLIKEPFFDINYKKIVLKKYYNKLDEKRSNGEVTAGQPSFRKIFDGFFTYIGYMSNGHCMRDWQDGTYTIYPEQCGVPYYFKPIK